MGSPNQNIYNVNYEGVETNLTPPNHRTPVWLSWLNVLLYPLQWIHNIFFNDYANGSNYAFYNSSNSYTVGTNIIDIDNAAYQLTLGGQYVTGFTVTSGGSGYVNPIISISGGGGTGATATVTITGGAITGIVLTNCGYGYTSAPTAIIVDDTLDAGGALATSSISASAPSPHLNVNNGIWVLINPDYRGVRPRTNFNGQKLVLEGILNQFFRTTFRQPPYGTLPDIYIENNALEDFVFVVGETEPQSSVAVHDNYEAVNYIEYQNSDFNFSGNAFTIFVPMSLYFSFAPAGIGNVTMINNGYGYASQPSVSFSGGGGTGALATATMGGIDNGSVVGITVTNQGSGYTSQPTVVISASPDSGGTASANAYPFSSVGTNTIRSVANHYVIAGMIYNVQPY
jgi:hypothetical protein